MLRAREAERLADERLRAEGSPWRATRATRSRRYGVWLVAYGDPDRPGEPLDGGALVVTAEGDVHDVGSAPGSLDDLMIALGRWPGLGPLEALAPATDTDAEALALLADVDPAEAADLAAYRDARRRGRGEA